jgi:hypothetical protein
MNRDYAFSHRKAAIPILSMILAGLVLFGGLTFAQSKRPVVNNGPLVMTENENPVIIEQSTSWSATIYRITEGDCKIEWTAGHNEIGVIKHESHCSTPLALQMTLLAKIIETFLNQDPNASSLRTLFWGRIEPDYSPGLHELSIRLALAAYQSPGWDRKRGRAQNGDINGFVKDLANRAMIYPELKDLFARFKKQLSFACAEKVLVVAAAKLPFYDRLKEHGVKATDKLPFDCMAWFSITDMPQD